MKKKMNGMMFLGMMFLVFALLQPVSAVSQVNIAKNKLKLKAMKFPVDVSIVAISVEQCLCDTELGRNLRVMVPKKIKVILYNEHSKRVEVETTVTYYTYGNKKKTTKKRFFLAPNQPTGQLFLTTYSIIKQSPGITASVKVISKKLFDKNMSNNIKTAKECQDYVQ